MRAFRFTEPAEVAPDGGRVVSQKAAVCVVYVAGL